MALQILPAPPSVGEGYDRLGQALLQGSRDYMLEKRQSDREAELRAQALADVASQRSYNDQRFQTESDRRLADQQALAEAAQRRAELERMIQAGYITPQDATDPVKLQAAYQRAQLDGVLTKNAPLISGGYLNAAEADDPDARARALNQMGAEAAQSRGDTLSEKANAAQQITQLEQQKRALQQRSSELDQALSTSTPLPTEEQIKAYATQKAQQAITGQKTWLGLGSQKIATPEQIAAQMDAAKTELTEIARTNDFQRKQNASVQKELLQNQLRDTQAQQTDLIRTFHVAPEASATTQPTQAAPPSAPAARAQVTPQQRSAVLAQLAGTTPPPANMVGVRIPTEQQPIPSANVSDPQAKAIIDAENQRRAELLNDEQIVQPMRQAKAQMDDIDAQIAKTIAAKPASVNLFASPYTLGYGGTGSYAAPTQPGAQATQLANLYQKRAAAQQQFTQLQARLQPAPLPATQPVVINTATNAPVFADPVANDDSAMGSLRVPPWNKNQFNVAPSDTGY